MKTSLFDFDLPQRCIAQHPVTPRDAAKMLVIGDSLTDAAALDLPDFLHPGDLLVFNDTRVIPSRLIVKRGDAKVELMLHKRLSPLTWRAFAKPAKKLKPGDTVQCGEDFDAVVEEKLQSGEVTVRFTCAAEDFWPKLQKHGALPLPPYIERDGKPGKEDEERYQTIYACKDGAVAAPTAGLHFTERLFDLLEQRGVKKTFVTLHVGAGTFLPVKAEDTDEHNMHSEYGVIGEEAAAAINRAKAAGGRVVAVGTTSLRILETAANLSLPMEKGVLRAFAGETDIFITPGYRFKCVDMLMTNFHLPKSTLFMLVSAFSGLEAMKAAYAHAIEHGYRFYSYGDACLLKVK